MFVGDSRKLKNKITLLPYNFIFIFIFCRRLTPSQPSYMQLVNKYQRVCNSDTYSRPDPSPYRWTLSNDNISSTVAAFLFAEAQARCARVCRSTRDAMNKYWGRAKRIRFEHESFRSGDCKCSEYGEQNLRFCRIRLCHLRHPYVYK